MYQPCQIFTTEGLGDDMGSKRATDQIQGDRQTLCRYPIKVMVRVRVRVRVRIRVRDRVRVRD